MTPPLFLVPELGTGPVIVLTGPEAHHAGTVQRLTVGERVWLSDGRGGLAEARVSELARDRLSFAVEHRRTVPEPSPRFVVVQALPKGERAELAVEVLTELGVDEIVPWSAARSISLWKGEKAAKGVAKWQRTALEATKQSRRARIPAVAELAGSAQVADRIRRAGLAIVLDADAAVPLPELAELTQLAQLAGAAGRAGLAGRHAEPDGTALSTGAPTEAPAELLLVVGPEGGLAPDELALFQASGARPARLGAEVLRTSTAGAAALAVLSVAVGRWR